MSTVTVYLRKDYKREDDLYPVYCQVTIKRNKVRFNTKVFCKSEDWDESLCSIKGRSKEVKDNNLIIADTVSKINDVFVRYRLMNREVTAAILKKEFENPSTYMDWFDFMTKVMNSKKGDNSENTIKTHQTLKKKLEDYRDEKKLGSIAFSDIDEEFIREFTKWMKNKKR